MEEQKKRRHGPEPKPVDQIRGERLSVYLTGAEAEEIRRRAARVKMRPPAYLRAAGLDRLPPTVPEINREAWRELARAAANLNQIARALNVGDHPGMREIVADIGAFRAALIGAVSKSEGGEDHEGDAED